MNKLLVSIAMATYNGEKYLREQLDSIINQTYQHFELVVCDDGSSDGTVDILNSYKSKCNIQVFVNKENLGYCRNFEKAISLCNGAYIALADQDDVWNNDKIERLVSEIGSSDAICSDAKLVDARLNLIHNSFKVYSNQRVTNDNNFFGYYKSYFVTGCALLFRAEMKPLLLPFPASLQYHDTWIGLCALKGNGLKYLEEQLFLYRQHGNNQVGAGVGSTSPKLSVNALRVKIINHKEHLRKIKIPLLLIGITQKKTLSITDSELKFLQEQVQYFEMLLHPKFSLAFMYFVLLKMRHLELKERMFFFVKYIVFLLVRTL